MFLVFSLLLCTFGHRYVDAQGQRIAPGVPPQHYQQQYDAPQQIHQQVHQQQQVHQPVHQQQQFQQQIPVQHVPQQQQQQQQQQHQQQQQQQQQFQQPQQQQQPPMQQQVPVQGHHGGHDHDHARNPQELLNAGNLEHEKAHIAEHMDVPIDMSKMTDQELQFHYFKMHDADNNNKLDGCELIKSVIHWHAEQENADPNAENKKNKLFIDDELSSLIDPILDVDDRNRDGYIDYPEFVQAQQKAGTTGQH